MSIAKRQMPQLGYPTKDVARILKISESKVRAFVKDGFVEPVRGERREFYFSFQDIVVLRAASELGKAVSAKRIHRALRQLRSRLPSGRALAGVQIVAQGNEICVQEGHQLWEAESGQAIMDFRVSDVAELVAPLAQASVNDADHGQEDWPVEHWLTLGEELEAYAPDEAQEAYLRALEIDSSLTQVYFLLAKLMQDLGDLPAAAEYYRLGLSQGPEDGEAWFNMAAILEELGHASNAISAYLSAINAENSCREAHYYVARLYDLAGQSDEAIKHLDAYKEVLSTRPVKNH
ncbi:MAG: tetratricopeptide repeat protein [Myxococcota bacterium]|nr:tetratricopeptide repeat protein [Myxococcota bacterium]